MSKKTKRQIRHEASLKALDEAIANIDMQMLLAEEFFVRFYRFCPLDKIELITLLIEKLQDNAYDSGYVDGRDSIGE